MSATQTTQPRQPKGRPVGGQFAAKENPEADFELEVEGPATAPQPGTGPALSNLDRTERIKAMQDEIASTIESMSNHEGWQKFLDTTAKFHRYSLNNALLIHWQRPDATMVAGFNDWKNKFGRSVKKGEKAIWILAPMLKTVVDKSEDGAGDDSSDTPKPGRKQLVGFRTVAVFDASQTEGDPLPADPTMDMSHMEEGMPPPGMVENLTATLAAHGYTVRRGDTGQAGGYTSPLTHEVVLSDKSNERQAARTLAHETAHVILGHTERSSEYHTGAGGHRSDMEIEAESVAYVVGRHWGIDEAGRYSFGYIDNWATGDAKKVRQTADRVVAAAKAILPE